MNIRIQSVQFDASEQLLGFVEKKVAKLERLFDGITSAKVFLHVVKPETSENKEVGIRLYVPGDELYASKIADSFEQAVDESVVALERQLAKYKERLRE